MHTFDTNGDIDEFKGAATNRQGDTIRLPGPGKCLIHSAFIVRST